MFPSLMRRLRNTRTMKRCPKPAGTNAEAHIPCSNFLQSLNTETLTALQQKQPGDTGQGTRLANIPRIRKGPEQNYRFVPQ